MKQKKAVQNRPVQQIKQKQSRRREIGGVPRFLVILLSVVLLAAALLASYARFRPVILTLPTQVYQYRRNADISYYVQNKPSDIFNQALQGMGSVYLSSNAVSILPAIKYEIRGNNIIAISGSYQMVAILRQLDKTDPNKLISSKVIPLTDKVEINTVDRGIKLEQSAQVDLAVLNDMAQELDKASKQESSYELEVGLQTDFTLSSSGREIAIIQERPGLVMPLGSDTFTVALLNLQDKKDSIWRFQNWRLELSPMPIWLYPAAILLSLLLLVFFIATTRARKRQKFNKQLRKMLRMARGRLMMIGDKAWEPEWCITASNFKTMVKTARRLKHPIFCFVDRESDVPAALFYVYYGENNYCYTYTGNPDRKWSKQVNQESSSGSNKSIIPEPLIDLPPAGSKAENEPKQVYISPTEQTELD